jgi:hypothetical protein
MSKKKKSGASTEAPKQKAPEVDEEAKEEAVEAALEAFDAGEVVSEAMELDDDTDNPEFRKALSKAEREALRKKAVEIAKKEAKQKMEDDYLKAEIAKQKKIEESKFGISDDEEMVRHTINLSSASDRMIINGKHYIHGHTYEVPASLAADMRDMEFRGHRQEDIRKGRNINEYGFRERNGIRSGSGVVVA